MVTLWAECYCGALRYGSHFFCKRPHLLCQSIVLLHENAMHYTPNLKAVYGCTSDRLWISPNLVLSVLYLTKSLRST